MCDDDNAQEMSCLASRHEDKSQARMIAPAGLINRRFEFPVQAKSAEKLPFILDAVVVFTTIAPITDDDDENLSCYIFNDHVRGVVERKTLELAASMTLAEIFGATSSSSINHHHHQQQAVFEFGNVQLELKQFGGRLIIYDAYLYLKPQSVDLSGNKDFSYVVAAEDDGAGHRGEAQVEEEVQSSPEGGRGSNQVGRPSKMGQIMGWACQSLKLQILQVICSNDNTTGHLGRQKKTWRNYTLNTLLFACTMLFSAYMDPSSSTWISIKILLVIDILVFIIINAILLIKMPNWGNALVCVSWFLLELAMCLLILPFNACYALAILAVLFLIVVVALLQPKFHHSVKKYVLPTTDAGDAAHGEIGKQEDEYLDHLLNISNSIATCGGLVTGIPGYYSNMEGSVTAAGFFFFCTLLLGLYLMMVIAMRAVSLPHAACLAIMLVLLLRLTVITASISYVRHSSETM